MSAVSLGIGLYRQYLPEELGRDGYPPVWHRELKHAVREAAGHRCVRCQHPYQTGVSPPEWSRCDELCEHGGPVRWRNRTGELTTVPLNLDADAPREAAYRILTVHHLDGDKANCRWWNLAALCQRCHLTIQGKVVMERVWPHEHSAWFRPYVAGYYAYRYLGEELTREETEARVDELLALEVRQEALAL